jgi:hypothetical protein
MDHAGGMKGTDASPPTRELVLGERNIPGADVDRRNRARRSDRDPFRGGRFASPPFGPGDALRVAQRLLLRLPITGVNALDLLHLGPERLEALSAPRQASSAAGAADRTQ